MDIGRHAFDAGAWYRDFVTWMRTERGPEAIEILSDCASELYLNALVALHLRRHGRDRGIEGWWARCEWGKVDISFGQATTRFADWDAAWHAHQTGDIGQIEGKLIYWHYSAAKMDSLCSDLLRQLRVRSADDHRYPRRQRYLGLVWLMCFESSDLDEQTLAEARVHRSLRTTWADTFARHSFVVQDVAVDRPRDAVFDLVATSDMRAIWPITGTATASLSVTMVEIAAT